MGISEMERLQHQWYAQLPAFGYKVEQAIQAINIGLTTMKNPYLAFSGGNDSLCLLDMLYHQGYQGDILFGDEGWDYPETIQFLKETEHHYGFHLKYIRDVNAWQRWCSEMGRPDLVESPDTPGVWHNPIHAWEYAWDRKRMHLMPTMVYDGIFLGMLASESHTRRITLRGGSRTLYQVKLAEGKPIRTPDGRDYEWHCCPLAAFTKQDIMAYLISRNIPYNPVYDTLASLGIPVERRRIAALSYAGVAQFGSFAVLKRGWSALFNTLAAIFPKVREYT